ncbi:hypothetical protein FSC845_05090 [Francisella persica ATCC VR-331]|nr:hypothetical protein FSC845_05090 [Francisella persica ATCC VR-331]
MINYLAILYFIILLLCSVIVLISINLSQNYLNIFPTIAIIYFVIVLLSTCGFWDTKSTEIIQTRSQLQNLILPIIAIFDANSL